MTKGFLPGGHAKTTPNILSLDYINTIGNLYASVKLSSGSIDLASLYAIGIHRGLLNNETTIEFIIYGLKFSNGIIIDSKTAHILLKIYKLSNDSKFIENERAFRECLLSYVCTKTVRVRLTKDN